MAEVQLVDFVAWIRGPIGRILQCIPQCCSGRSFGTAGEEVGCRFDNSNLLGNGDRDPLIQ